MVVVVHTFRNSQEEIIKENPMISQEVPIIKNVNSMVQITKKVNFLKVIVMTKRKSLQEKMIVVILLKREEFQNQMIVMTLRKRARQQKDQEKEENNI